VIKSRKHQAGGHISYGKRLIKSGIKEIVITTADRYINGAFGYTKAGSKIVKGVRHYIKGKRMLKKHGKKH